ncbi:TVP38/TMEM64 family protein [Bowmanella dokdonensis]|uniref:TVP38/TMEM64 family membrane protein n=1 Tax=Bowmanella dokdonensis TaxID=751969 RepID=A0A939DQF2_9ALTE|nr:VTT domain-containing protein [Bowmanella dokdonensis]MBN7826854.1 VTT domain-containing protein [Bowmanella dokdonensis]
MRSRLSELLSPALAKNLLWLAALLAVGWFMGKSTLLGHWHPDALAGYLQGPWYQQGLIFVSLFALLTSVGLPRQIPAFAAGFFYGVLPGLGISTLAVLLGAALTLLYTRLPLISRLHLKQTSHPMLALLYRFPFRATLAIRLFPVGNNLAMNLLAGFARLPVRPFLLASLLGYLPQMLIFALSGAGLMLDTRWQILLALALMLLSSWLGLAVYRRTRRHLSRLQEAHSHA